MLSAVAARKARLAQSQSQPSTPHAVSPPPEPKSKAPLSTQKPPAKRKQSPPPQAASKKKKSQHRKPEQPPRYFAHQDAFKSQEDVIVVDDSDGDSSSSSSRGTPPQSPPPASRIPPARQRRAWSPSAPLPDSSDEGEDNSGDPIVLNVPIPPLLSQSAPQQPSISLSTFNPVLNQNVFHLPPTDTLAGRPSLKRVAILLNALDTLALLGTYTITVLSGSLTLAGVRLVASSHAHPVFAPRCSPIPVIECLPSRSSTTTSNPVELPTHVAEAANQCDAVIVVQELRTGIEGLGRICRTFDGVFAPSRWHKAQSRFDLGLDTVYFLSQQTPDVSPLIAPPSWNAAIVASTPPAATENELMTPGLTYLVRGPKNAGKSTLARLLLNSLLSKFRRVAYLECDLGQSEFTPGGMVSLNVVDQPIFGPPFSHPSLPYASHYIGATSPRTSPSRYLDSIQALVQLYNSELQDTIVDDETEAVEDDRIQSVIPLIVNTMGWTKGLGADLERKVEVIVEATHIFTFEDSPAEDDIGALHSQQGSSASTIHTIEAIPPSSLASHFTAADYRNLALLSYFHAIFPSNRSPTCTSPIATSWNTTLPLCALAPYEVDCNSAIDKIILTGAGAEDVIASELSRSLNGAIVALVSCQPGTLDNDAAMDAGESSSSSFPYEQGASPPLPQTSSCVGLALIRALSPSPTTHLQLLTSVPPHLLESARVLVMGELQLPVWGMLDFRTLDDGGDIAGYERGKVPYLRWGKGEGAGGERRRVRRNLMRKGQL